MKLRRSVKNMRNIDATTSSFEALITNKLVYVDKTDYLYSLVRKGVGYYFLSRPRRFGKSLTVSTLEAIFKGKKELFKGLYIGQTDYDFKEYPVIHLDFSKVDNSTIFKFKKSLQAKLFNIATEYSVSLGNVSIIKDQFESLIKNLSKKGGGVVILIDEYDKPLSDNVNELETALKIRDVLRGFFEIIKASSDYIRFAFITGVTKFSKVSIFSAMNNLFDLSVNRIYSAMLGYTQEELEHYFAPGIEEGISALNLPREDYLAKVKEWYDGYLFAPMGEKVYNPVAIGKFFDDGGRTFNSFWSTTGGQKLIYDLAYGSHFNVETDIEKNLLLDSLSGQDIVELATGDLTTAKYNSLLFQTGYLTIVDSKLDGRIVSLGFPNRDVSEFFTNVILPLYLGERNEYRQGDALIYLSEGDIDSFIIETKAVFASIPYDTKSRYEHTYEVAFYCILIAMGAQPSAEVHTNKGRADLVLEVGDHIYIFEFKVGTTAEEALSQIKEKGYAEKYKALKYKDKTLHLVGVSFSEENRNIDEVLHEIVLKKN